MRKATLGPVEIVLPQWLDPEDRYQRRYIGVTPASRQIPGSDDLIAPETDIAQWVIRDWSAGEGDIVWEDAGRYNYSSNMAPTADGSGIVPGMNYTTGTGQTEIITRGGGRLVAAEDADDNIYEWNGSSWSSLWAIGGTASRDIVSIASLEPTTYYVLDNTGEVRKVQSASNSALVTGLTNHYLVGFNGALYSQVGTSLTTIDTSTGTRTAVASLSSSAHEVATSNGRVRLLTTSDVGPFWACPIDDGVTLLREYNVADDTPYTIGELPKDSFVYDVLFHAGIYFAAFRQADTHASSGDAYLYYQVGGSRGVAGPIRAPSGTTASKRIAFAGAIGDRIMLAYDDRLWAYDLTTGGISEVADWSSDVNVGEPLSATVFGKDVFVGSNAGYAFIETDEVKASTNGVLYTGRFDFGYNQLPKLLHTVTVVTEDQLAAAHSVEVGYLLDGNTVQWLSDDMATGEASHTWVVSDNAESLIAIETEWAIRASSTSATSFPKVIALYSDASGAAARIEWAVAVDVGESSVNDGGDVITALNSLRTSYGVVQWSDPYQVDPYTADQAFDVRVKDVLTPMLSDDGHLYATVVFQTIGTVGPDLWSP